MAKAKVKKQPKPKKKNEAELKAENEAMGAQLGLSEDGDVQVQGSDSEEVKALKAKIAKLEFDSGAPTAAPDMIEKPDFHDDVEREYWVGTLKHSPIKDWHLAGICFPKTTDILHTGGGIAAKTQRVPRRGDVLMLKPSKAWDCIQASKRKFSRPTNEKRTRFASWSTSAKYYTPKEGDIFATELVYIVEMDRVAEMYGANWREKTEEPKPLSAFMEVA